MARAPAASVAPTPSEPSAPAFETAAASRGVDTPAIGAWMIGSSIPSWVRNVESNVTIRRPPSLLSRNDERDYATGTISDMSSSPYSPAVRTLQAIAPLEPVYVHRALPSRAQASIIFR